MPIRVLVVEVHHVLLAPYGKNLVNDWFLAVDIHGSPFLDTTKQANRLSSVIWHIRGR